MNGLVNAYRSKLLDGAGMAPLSNAYDRAGLSEGSVHADRDQHINVLTSVILPEAARGLALFGITALDAYRLFQQFQPLEAGRLRSDSAEARRLSKGTATVALEYLRHTLQLETAVSEQLSLQSTGARPLLNHLARELLFWAYAAELDPALRDALKSNPAVVLMQNDPSSPDENWQHVVDILISRIRSDLKDSKSEVSAGSWNDEVAVAQIATLPEPDELAQVRAEVIRDFMIIAATWDRDRLHNLGRCFFQRLLLRFAYTGCTYTLRDSPDVRKALTYKSEADQRRVDIISVLHDECQFKEMGDPALGDQLHWLMHDIKTKKEDFGSEFTKSLALAADVYVTKRVNIISGDHRAKEAVFLLDSWSEGDPRSEIAVRWRTLSEQGEPSRFVCDRALLEALSEEVEHLEQTPSALGQLDESIPEECALEKLQELQELLGAYCTAKSRGRESEYLKKLPKSIKKFFTTLCRAQTGRGADIALSPEEWLQVADTVSELGASEHAMHLFRDVWKRLDGPLVVRTKAGDPSELIARLEQLAPALEPIAGFGEPAGFDDEEHAQSVIQNRAPKP